MSVWWLLALWPALSFTLALLWCLLCHLARRNPPTNGQRL